MDVGKNDARICNGNTTSSVVVSNDGMDKGKEDHGESRSLLSPSLRKGGIKGRRQRSGSKKVQWNDRNGDKLVEVLEFQPREEEEEEASPAGAEEVAKLFNTGFLHTKSRGEVSRPSPIPLLKSGTEFDGVAELEHCEEAIDCWEGRAHAEDVSPQPPSRLKARALLRIGFLLWRRTLMFGEVLSGALTW